MPQSTSRSELKFLLDENVKGRVGKFLKSQGFDAISAPKRFSDNKLAYISKSEGRILVTNDSDFTNPAEFSKEKVFSVVLLEIPQDNPEAFSPAFSRLLKSKSKPEDFEGNLIELTENDDKVSKIPSVTKFKFSKSA